MHKDILRDALDITPSIDNNPFVAPPSSDTVIEYVNTLGYPCTLRNVSAMFVNALYQPWRAILSMINMCLTSKTAGYDRQRHPVLQILWGITHHSNIDYAERIWEEYVRKDGREIFGMPIPDALLTDAIKSTPYYNSYLEHVTEYQRYLNEEHDKEDDKSPKPASSQPPKPTPTLTKSSKKDQGKKRKLVMESTDAPSPAKRSKAGKVTKKLMPTSSLQLVDEVVDDPPIMMKRRTLMPTKPYEHADSSSLDAELTLSNSETESEEEVPVIKDGDQDEGQAEPNPETTDASPQQKPEQIDEEFTTTAYPNEEEPGKTNAEAEVQLMVSVPIHQNTSSVPPMTTPVIDLIKSQSDSPLLTSIATTSTITTTTTLPPPPLQSTTNPILVRRIGELEPHITDLIQNNLALEERLDKHGSRLYKLENLNIPYQVSKVVDEIVTDAVDWAISAEVSRARLFKSTDDSIPEEHVLLSDDEDSKNDHQPKADLRKDWRKPLPEEERPTTPEPAWTIPSSIKSNVVNNWAFVLATTYELPAENSLLAKIGDMTTFMNWYCQKVNKTMLTQADFEGHAYEVVKTFYLDVIHLHFQMEEYHKKVTAQVDWMNPEGDQVRIDVNRPLPLGAPPGHVTI
ncbi:hypothetical protein Tco_0533893 [Tanacetum coccineum]